MFNLPRNSLIAGLSIIVAFFFAKLFMQFYPVFINKPIYIFSVPVICILFVLFLKNPALMLTIIILSRALLDPALNESKIYFLGINVGVGGMINLIILVFWWFLHISKQINKRRPLQLTKNWMIFLLICGITIIYSPEKGDAVKLWLNLLTYAAMFYLPVYFIRDEFDKKRWLKILLFSTVLPVIFAYYDLLFRGGKYFSDAGIRIYGTFTHPNILAFYILFAIVLVFYMLKTGLFKLKRPQRNILTIYLFALFVLLLGTKTRSAWAACWVFFIIYGWLKEKKYVFFSLTVPFLLLLNKSVLSRLQDLTYHTAGDLDSGLNSWAWRMELWKKALPEITRSFLWGKGLSSFMNYSRSFITTSVGRGMAAHSAFLQILFETGIFGTMAFLSIFISLIRNTYHKVKGVVTFESALLIAFVFSYLVTCLGDNLLYYLAYNWYFFFFIGLILHSKDIAVEAE